jgi:hypothetical protein
MRGCRVCIATVLSTCRTGHRGGVKILPLCVGLAPTPPCFAPVQLSGPLMAAWAGRQRAGGEWGARLLARQRERQRLHEDGQQDDGEAVRVGHVQRRQRIVQDLRGRGASAASSVCAGRPERGLSRRPELCQCPVALYAAHCAGVGSKRQYYRQFEQKP